MRASPQRTGNVQSPALDGAANDGAATAAQAPASTGSHPARASDSADLDGKVARIRRSVPEFALVVPAPAGDVSARQQRTRAGVANRYVCRRADAADIDRGVARRGIAVAELPVLVRAPAGHASASSQ